MVIVVPFNSNNSNQMRESAGKVFSGQDPLLGLVGADTSEGDADTSINIHAYLADAYEHR